MIEYSHRFNKMHCYSCDSDGIPVAECMYCEESNLISYECAYCCDAFGCIRDEREYCYGNELEKRIYTSVDIIVRFLKLRVLKTKLVKYSRHILEDYIHPDSLYVRYMLANSQSQIKRVGLAFITNNNELRIIHATNIHDEKTI